MYVDEAAEVVYKGPYCFGEDGDMKRITRILTRAKLFRDIQVRTPQPVVVMPVLNPATAKVRIRTQVRAPSFTPFILSQFRVPSFTPFILSHTVLVSRISSTGRYHHQPSTTYGKDYSQGQGCLSILDRTPRLQDHARYSQDSNYDHGRRMGRLSVCTRGPGMYDSAGRGYGAAKLYFGWQPRVECGPGGRPRRKVECGNGADGVARAIQRRNEGICSMADRLLRYEARADVGRPGVDQGALYETPECTSIAPHLGHHARHGQHTITFQAEVPSAHIVSVCYCSG